MDIVAAAGREIVVDTVRAVKAALSLLPGEGFCRVVIFDEADTLNPHAQNALLAVLEEPPSHAAFLLCTAVPEALLLTVRSRCAVVRLPHAEETAEEPDESVASLVAAIAQKDEWACCQIVLSWEKCKREELEKRLFQLSAALRTRLETADPLTGKRFYCILDGVCALRDSLRRNAGVGHVCGALACQLVN